MQVLPPLNLVLLDLRDHLPAVAVVEVVLPPVVQGKPAAEQVELLVKMDLQPLPTQVAAEVAVLRPGVILITEPGVTVDLV